MKPAPFRFSLLGMLGLTTIVAVALAAVRESLGLAGLLCAVTTWAVWFTSVLSMAFLRDAYHAMRRRDWGPLRFYRHWFFWAMLLANGWVLFQVFAMPRADVVAEVISRQTAEAIRIAGVIMGVTLAAVFVSDRRFWERNDQAQ